MPVSSPCQGIRDEIAAISQDITDFQAMLKDATPSEKEDIAAAIKALQEELKDKRRELENCLMIWWRIKSAPPVR